ncbi:MipA/OmpV family protein [Pseudoalteromonas peptidolytica]|uniref:Outer membrane protein n=1 Tax=Pseudoalteromonas peptidolytica F12-50-A1 TaxID=1315280 RepID=A0A8I0MW06_9GAMM|nr:MipA/OmpV family protein [Pseudoalteromonas peptidolytica]MBE0346523.1 outer membrane protein [Pseudoalteromonas peptidolytica F12-50-A1]NLR17147.1 MipA/OmpV family protein [Pseudoalteromonas peptidolytica]GEK10554.1 structural protein MipA [Pseudoalteromonas peptidolytica]
MARKLLNLVTTMSIICSTQVLADAPPESPQLKWGIGAAIISQDQGYVGIGNETEFVPAVAIQYGNFSLLGPRANYKVYQTEQFEVSLSAHLRLDGFEANDSDYFIGMEDRDMSFDAGFEMEYDTSFGEFGFEFMHDVSSTHKGYEASVSYGVPFRFEDGRVFPYIAANFQSEDLVDYYYGVQATEALTNRAFYLGDSSTAFEVGIQSDWFLGKHHMIKADISYTSYGSEIKDSPLVDASGSAQIIFGYVYVF